MQSPLVRLIFVALFADVDQFELSFCDLPFHGLGFWACRSSQVSGHCSETASGFGLRLWGLGFGRAAAQIGSAASS